MNQHGVVPQLTPKESSLRPSRRNVLVLGALATMMLVSLNDTNQIDSLIDSTNAIDGCPPGKYAVKRVTTTTAALNTPNHRAYWICDKIPTTEPITGTQAPTEPIKGNNDNKACKDTATAANDKWLSASGTTGKNIYHPLGTGWKGLQWFEPEGTRTSSYSDSSIYDPFIKGGGYDKAPCPTMKASKENLIWFCFEADSDFTPATMCCACEGVPEPEECTMPDPASC